MTTFNPQVSDEEIKYDSFTNPYTGPEMLYEKYSGKKYGAIFLCIGNKKNCWKNLHGLFYSVKGMKIKGKNLKVLKPGISDFEEDDHINFKNQMTEFMIRNAI